MARPVNRAFFNRQAVLSCSFAFFRAPGKTDSHTASKTAHGADIVRQHEYAQGQHPEPYNRQETQNAACYEGTSRTTRPVRLFGMPISRPNTLIVRLGASLTGFSPVDRSLITCFPQVPENPKRAGYTNGLEIGSTGK
jgi:hypothetical protein